MDFEPSDLQFSFEGPEVDYSVTSSPTGNALNWAFVPQAFVDVVDTGTDKYEIRFYDWTSMSTNWATHGSHSPPAGVSPYIAYEIRKSSSGRLYIKKDCP